MWSLAKVLNGFADLGNERFHTFAIKKNDKVVGELKFASRPKNAGGPAWKAKLFNAGDCDMDVCFYDKNKNKVLDWIKTDGYKHIKRREEFRANKENVND